VTAGNWCVIRTAAVGKSHQSGSPATAQSPAILYGAEYRAALVNRREYLRVQMGHEVSETKASITD
jgi:hypothetical protein